MVLSSWWLTLRNATEKILDHWYTDVPLDGPSWIFGDNQSAIISSIIPESSLNKWHSALSYHFFSEDIASKIIYFFHVKLNFNSSDLFTNILGWDEFWPLIQPLLFWKGETIIPEKPLPEKN
jgi:hypothetical protein